MKKGFLISFEGGEGCGKSTQLKKFAIFLEEEGFDFLITREPGGTEVGEKIRNILLHDKAALSSKTEFLLFSASRCKLIEEVIIPALNEGKIVVLDRYFDSSYTYQGYAGNLNLQDLQTITNFAIGDDAQPDLTVLLDLSYEEGFQRKSADERLKNLDRIEQKGKEYHDKVRAGYLQLAKDNPRRIFVVDATKTQDEIFEIVKFEFKKRYQNCQNGTK
ncbi:MAG: dTMP kinase [Clostridia bacterium]|nr:dTMP kinase [Clostridia bacterium]